MTVESYHPNRRAVALAISASLVAPRPASAITPVTPRSEATTLRAVAAKRKLAPDAAVEADTLALEGLGPGGVLRIRHGDELRATLANDTPLPLSLHWHGVRAPNVADGVGGLALPPVPPGGRHEIRFTPPDPGTFLIRPVTIGGASEPAGRGIGGLLIVEEREPPAVHAEHALLVRDWRTEPEGSLSPFGAPVEAALAGRLGNRITVEGQDAPRRIEAPPGARLRLRLANGCNARIMRIRFDGLKVLVAAVDGQPTDVFQPLRSTLPFPPGTRYDLFVDLPPEAGSKGAVVALLGDGLPLIEIIASAAGEPAKPGEAKPLPPNRILSPEIKLQNAVRRDVTIAGGAARGANGEPVFSGDPKAIWTIGKLAGATTNPPLFTARRGQPVVIGVHNTTGFPQPMHLHGHVFRLLHNLDDGWEPYWLDTLQVPEGKTSRIAFMADNPGKWLLASTVLERFDTGLWTWFEVT